MAGTGRAPKRERRNKSDKPIRGEWKAAPGFGWQHGAIPDPPDGLLAASREAWVTWFKAWFASHWTPNDFPMLRQLVRLYDQCERGEFQRAAELRLLADTLGITPKGRQDRRWIEPEPDAIGPRRRAAGSPYGHLRAVR
ncbi:MAG: hypothetical protein QOJ81_2193 [Chloroflexota bacterium]|nr:hypothetical protein [Chloroflexota bacterium]